MKSSNVLEFNAIEIANQKHSFSFCYGKLYCIFSSIIGIQKVIFRQGPVIAKNDVVHLHGPFAEAVRIQGYIDSHKNEFKNIKYLQEQFRVTSFEFKNFEMLDNMLFAALDHLQRKNIVTIDTSGMAHQSIAEIVKVSKKIMDHNENKMIIIILGSYIGKEYPVFQSVLVDNYIVDNFDVWLDSIGVNTEEKINFRVK